MTGCRFIHTSSARGSICVFPTCLEFYWCCLLTEEFRLCENLHLLQCGTGSKVVTTSKVTHSFYIFDPEKVIFKYQFLYPQSFEQDNSRKLLGQAHHLVLCSKGGSSSKHCRFWGLLFMLKNIGREREFQRSKYWRWVLVC